MHRRSLALIAILVVALLATGGGVYAYDQGKDGQIAEGIKVNGVDVGGLSASQARTKLRTALLEPAQPARHGPLRGQDLQAHADARRRSASTSTARSTARWSARARATSSAAPGARSAASRSTPTWTRRSPTRAPRCAASSRGCSATSTSEPVDAKRRPRARQRRPAAVQGRPRRPRRPPAARPRARAAGRRPRAASCACARRSSSRRSRPSDLAKKYPAVLIVNRGAFQLTLYKNLKPAKTYGVAIGKIGLETPAGLYHIQNKAVNPAWTMPNSDWVAPEDRGKIIPGGTPRTRSRPAGWASSPAPASTAPTRTARSAPPRRTAACGCASRT